METITAELALKSILEKIDGLNAGKNRGLLTPQEAAAFLGVKPQTLALWRTKATGPEYIKVGNCVRYDLEALQAYVDKNRVIH